MVRKVAERALLALVLWVGSWSKAYAQPVTCAGPATRDTVVRCALRASPSVYADVKGVESVEGRRTTASLLLPANPSLALSVGQRTSRRDGDGVDFGATLSQELEIGGQRGARLDVVGAEGDAVRARLRATRREVAATALSAYFDVLAATEEKRVATRLSVLSGALIRLAAARLEAGLGSEIEAEVASAAGTRLAQTLFAAERRVAATRALLTTLLGFDPVHEEVAAQGELEPLVTVPGEVDLESLVRGALAQRADVAIAQAEQRQHQRRAELFRRSRIPNLTFSLFAQNERFNERVLGGGLAVPIPLPAPVGHTYAGETAEAEALAQRSGFEVERLRRSVRLEVVAAFGNVASRKRELGLFSPERLRRAEDALAAIALELEARRLSVRDALLTQQGLVELLQGHIEARRLLCLASVELARVAGLPLGQEAS